MQTQNSIPPEEIREALGRKRFRTDGYSDSDIRVRANNTAQVLLSRLPSNYPRITGTNVGLLFRLVGEETQRYFDSLQGISQDLYYDNTRPEFLYQNLASFLFLGAKAIGSPSLTDEEYRSFLLKVRDAYLRGSSKDSIETSLADILGLTVVIRELYQEAKQPNSPFTVKDTHRMLCDILMDGTWDRPVGDLLQDVSFYTSLIKPAHTILESRLVWNDSVGVAGGCYPGDYIGSDANGAVPSYSTVVDPAAPRSYLLRMMAYAGSDSQMVNDYVVGTGPAWQTGTISALDSVNRKITLTGGLVLVTGSDSLFYKHDTDGDYRVLFSDLTLGAVVQYQALDITGLFQFYHMPPDLVGHPDRAFDPAYNRKPAFQENVIKDMDAQGRFPVVLDKCQGALSDVWVTDVLEPLYEDLRDDCSYATAKPYSVFIAGSGASLTVNEPAATIVSGLYYTITPNPVLNNSENLASASDLVTYLDNSIATGWIASLDPVSGLVVLTGSVPAGSVLRIDFMFSSRYPAADTFEYVAPDYGAVSSFPNVGAQIGVLTDSGVVKHLYWPSRFVDPSWYGDDRDIQVDHFPILNQLGALASASDVQVFVDDVLVPGAVVSIKPLLGHVRLSFLPVPGADIKVKYHYTEKPRSYAFVVDDDSCTFDAEYGNDYSYSLVPDYPDDFDVTQPIQSEEPIKSVGIRYRGYQLAASSVLNSAANFSLNDFSAPVEGGRASILSSRSKVGNFSLLYSPEHLTDKSKYVGLNDTYLQNGLPAVTTLLPGVPTFQKTFTDQAGLIRNMPISDFRTNKQVLSLSDYKEFRVESGRDAALSSICDSRGMHLELKDSTVKDEYFPNREMRLNDYMDYVSKLSTTIIASGTLAAIGGSNVIKSIGILWTLVPRGATVSVGSHTYTVLDVRNSDTIALASPVSLVTGEYSYSIQMEEAPAVKVNLNDLVRKIDLNISSFQAGYTPSVNDWVVTLDFPDPDPDPYPRTADNFNYPTPTAPLLIADIHDDSGARDLLLDSETATKLVKWRNWDQGLVVTGELGATGVSPASYPNARIRPGATGAPWKLYNWNVYSLTNESPMVPSSTFQELVGT